MQEISYSEKPARNGVFILGGGVSVDSFVVRRLPQSEASSSYPKGSTKQEEDTKVLSSSSEPAGMCWGISEMLHT